MKLSSKTLFIIGYTLVAGIFVILTASLYFKYVLKEPLPIQVQDHQVRIALGIGIIAITNLILRRAKTKKIEEDKEAQSSKV